MLFLESLRLVHDSQTLRPGRRSTSISWKSEEVLSLHISWEVRSRREYVKRTVAWLNTEAEVFGASPVEGHSDKHIAVVDKIGEGFVKKLEGLQEANRWAQVLFSTSVGGKGKNSAEKVQLVQDQKPTVHSRGIWHSHCAGSARQHESLQIVPSMLARCSSLGFDGMTTYTTSGPLLHAMAAAATGEPNSLRLLAFRSLYRQR